MNGYKKPLNILKRSGDLLLAVWTRRLAADSHARGTYSRPFGVGMRDRAEKRQMRTVGAVSRMTPWLWRSQKRELSWRREEDVSDFAVVEVEKLS